MAEKNSISSTSISEMLFLKSGLGLGYIGEKSSNWISKKFVAEKSKSFLKKHWERFFLLNPMHC